MKICLVHNIYGDQARGGAETMVNSLAIALLKRAHQVTILTTHTKKSVEKNSEHAIAVIKVPSSYTQRQEHSQLWRFVSHIFGFVNIAAFFRYKSIFKKESFDMVWVHNTVGFGMILFLTLKKEKFLQTFHDIQFLYPSGLLLAGKEKILTTIQARIYRFLIRLYVPINCRQIFPSAWLKEIHQKFGMISKDAIVLRNQAPELEPQPLMGEGPNFLFVGQLEPHKGPELLIDSFVKLARPDISLWIIGSGSLEENLKKKYEQKNIRFLAKMENPLPFIASAHCLVVPSLCYENLPTVILEASLFKTLTIGSRLGGISEALGDELLTFEPNEDECLKKLQAVLENFTEYKNRFIEAQKKYPSITVDEYLNQLSASLGITL